MSEFKPIHTLNHQEWFLALDEDGDMYKCRLMETDLDGTGIYEAACGQPVAYTPNPTHWMKLPELPNAKDNRPD